MKLLERVEVYSSYAYAVEPRVFYVQDARHQVSEVQRRWKTPGCIHFFVRDEKQRSFELVYDEMNDRWFIESPNLIMG